MSSISTTAAFGNPSRAIADRPTIFDWIKRKLNERQQRIAEKKLIAQLRSMDRHQLDDIDIDPEQLAQGATLALAHHNPHVIAACMFAGSLNRGCR